MDISFIGFGGAAYGLTKGLKQEGFGNVYFFDKSYKSKKFGEIVRKRASETGALYEENIEDLVNSSDMVISCVTGSMAVTVAREAAPFLKSGQLYVDVNTTSPAVKELAAAIVEKSGAEYADAAMMGGIPTWLHRVPIFSSGKGAERFKTTMEPFGMRINVLSKKPGQATAIKMFRSIFMKGILALFLEVMEAADHYQATDLVLGSIAETMDKTSFLETARLIVTKGVVNADRMAHEMAEVIETIEAADALSIMSMATRDRLQWCRQLNLQEFFGGEIPKSLEEVLKALKEKISQS